MSTQKNTNVNTSIANILTVNEIEKNSPEHIVSSAAFSTMIRQLLINWRQGTVGSKGRADVSLSTKKPWKQKGTGRARAGTARSPLWRGGGITFGPQPRTRTLKVSKKLRKGVLSSLFWERLNKGDIISLDWILESKQPKTALAYQVLKDTKLHDKKIIVMLPFDDALHYASLANIPTVKVVFFDEINAYDLALAEKWIILNKDLDIFKETVAKWI